MPRKAWLAAAIAAAIILVAWVYLGPPPEIRRERFAGATLLDRNGVVLYEPLASDGSRSEWVTAVPHRVEQATIAAEDRRFFSHHGIDVLAVGRAALQDLRRRAFVEGGSTITQQVAKLLRGRSGRALTSKAAEAVDAIRLERRYSKQEILALYLNLAPYGNQIRGISRASRTYFGCAPEDLTAAQAAYLAALPQRPGAFSPLRDATRAMERQRTILQRMRRLGLLTDADFQLARAERLRFDRGRHTLVAQHFVERVLEQVPNRGVIRSTLDAQLQRIVGGIIASHRADLLRHGAHSAAVAVLDNATGEWLAWEGSGDYFGDSFGGAIDGVVAPRQPGSALKPFTYAVAFERGLSPATILPDIPTSFSTAQDGVVYTPRNYDGRYRGPLRARAALAGSENVPAVALLSKVGVPSLLRLLRNIGFRELDRNADYYGLGLTLGDAEVRLSELVAAYSTFPRGGVYLEPRMLPGGPAQRRVRLLSPRTSFWITDVLSDSEARAFVFGSGGSLDFPFQVAVKTGTSQAYRDNWTIGYTRDVTVGVWVGNFGRQELRGSSGVTGAGPIFHDVMLAAAHPDGAPILSPPPDMERVEVCSLSGLRPSLSCPTTESEWMPRDAPVEFCSWHHAGGLVDWPDEYRRWARMSELPLQKSAEAKRAAAPLRVISPPDGSTYLIDPTLRKAYQMLPLRALSRSRVAWRVDDQDVGVASEDGTVRWPLKAGRHTITARDESGNRESVRIFVK